MPSFIPVNNVPGPGFYFDDNSLNEIKASPSRPLLEKKPYNSEEELINDFFFSKNGNKEEGNEYDFKKEQAENFKRKIMSKIKQKNIPFLSTLASFSYLAEPNAKIGYPITGNIVHKNAKPPDLLNFLAIL